MLGMRLGGIDPSILRELSGVYKPFVKAFKELISNAFDADAESVLVGFSDDFSSVTVTDDGQGMSPFEFRGDFARIGGGSRRWAGDKTRKGRLRIGSKGIGFLALARYCDRLEVESGADRTFETHLEFADPPSSLEILPLLAVPISTDLLQDRISIEIIRPSGRGTKLLKEGKDYRWNHKRMHLAFDNPKGPNSIVIKVSCEGLRFKAQLDFEKLLRLADNADLEKLDDFATIDIFDAREDKSRDPKTVITAKQLKPFVCRELRSARRKGFVRNIGSQSGFAHFLWNLSRCTPIPYSIPAENPNPSVEKALSFPQDTTLARLEVVHAGSSVSLRRPVFPLEPGSQIVPADMLIKVDIDQGGLKARGFLAGYETIIFPAEYRGISIRVRGVAIGDSGFFGAEGILTGANRAALSQITGEIIVISGLDATDTLNPGRESFYEESEHFKILRRQLIGEGERVGGYVWQIISAVLRRSAVRSGLSDTLGKAALRHKALDDISSAVSNFINQGDATAQLLRTMLLSQKSSVNGLASTARWKSASHQKSAASRSYLPRIWRTHPRSTTVKRQSFSTRQDPSGNGRSFSLNGRSC